HGRPPSLPPRVTALGSLLHHTRRVSDDYQPSNVVWSMFPEQALPENQPKNKALRRQLMAERALAALENWHSPALSPQTGRERDALGTDQAAV
ncbi:MAG TPA: hypothetical protein VFZ61_09470, partial [Polyangiales bacterium]